MIPMIATKSLRYATRDLLPEDTFEALSAHDARTLAAIGKARYATVDARAAEAPGGESAVSVLAQADALPFLAFKSAAAKILGDETPAKKAEIVAALQALIGVDD